MAKTKKKRNKPYRGQDASLSRPVITRVQAVNRNRVQQWWFERKRVAKPVLITVAVIVILVWLIVELVRLFAS